MKTDRIGPAGELIITVVVAIVALSLVVTTLICGRDSVPRQHSTNELRQLIREEVRAALDGGTQ